MLCKLCSRCQTQNSSLSIQLNSHIPGLLLDHPTLGSDKVRLIPKVPLSMFLVLIIAACGSLGAQKKAFVIHVWPSISHSEISNQLWSLLEVHDAARVGCSLRDIPFTRRHDQSESCSFLWDELSGMGSASWDCTWDLQKTGNKVFSLRCLRSIIPENQEIERGCYSESTEVCLAPGYSSAILCDTE